VVFSKFFVSLDEKSFPDQQMTGEAGGLNDSANGLSKHHNK
jgi:hypothetical protein